MQRIGQRVDDLTYSHISYGDVDVFVADLGPGVSGSIEVLDDVALLVVEGDGETHQHELALPDGDAREGDARAYINNGVVTIEVGA